MDKIRKGMQVIFGSNQQLGTVENVTADSFTVNGRSYPLNTASRVENNRVYLSGDNAGAATGYQQNANEIKVPVVEEQLNVQKRQGQMGEVQVQKTVREEQQSVPVELRREEVQVHERDIEDRPLQPGEENVAFREGTIRVPVYGEEAVTNKQAVVTGEVHLKKDVTAEQRQVSDTVRKEQVNVDKNFQQGLRGSTTDDTGYSGADADTHYTDAATTGYTGSGKNQGRDRANYSQDYGATGASGYGSSQVQEGAEVVGVDEDYIGRVKEVSGNTVLVDRKMQRDVYVPLEAIQGVDGGRVRLNIPSDQVDDQGWDNPPLTGGSSTGY